MQWAWPTIKNVAAGFSLRQHRLESLGHQIIFRMTRF